MADNSKGITGKQIKKPRPASFNVAQSKDLYTSLPAPKPRRTHSAGLSGIVELITEHLKNAPPPSLRQSSPHAGKHIAHPYITHESNRCSSASITEEQHHDTFNPSGINLGSSMFQTQNGPVAMLAEFCATPFLGDRKSESGDLNLLFASSVGVRRNGQRIGEHNFTMLKGFRRSFSLEGISAKAALTPCMIAMPAGRPYYDLSDALESIPQHSWILPYVIACTPPEILGQLLTLPFLVDGQSHTHTTATAITRSRAHTISFDIDPVESENALFTVPLNIKRAARNIAEITDNTSADPNHEQDTSFASTDDWYSYETDTPYEMPLRESNPRLADCMSSTSPLDDLPVTRARGHTHTGSVYELPDPSLFHTVAPKATSRARDSLGRKKDGDFGSLIRMSSASPRSGSSGNNNSNSGGGKSDRNIKLGVQSDESVLPKDYTKGYMGGNSNIQIPSTVPASTNASTTSITHPPLLSPAPIKPKSSPFTLTNPNPVPIPRTPSPAALGIGINPQLLNFPTSWRSLGILWLCSDPKWNQWQPKIVFLLDNYLLECTAVGTAVIGYSQLSHAMIEKKVFQYHTRLPTTHLSAPKPHKPHTATAIAPVVTKDKHNAAGNSAEDDYFHEILTEDDPESSEEFSPRYLHTPTSPFVTNHKGNKNKNINHSNNDNTKANPTHTYHTAHGVGQLASYGLKITCFTTSNTHTTTDTANASNTKRDTNNSSYGGRFNKNAMEPCTHSFWLTTHDEAALDLIAIALQRASTLTFEDVFEVQTLTGEDSLLGQGRFNEVRLARRREDLDLLNNPLHSTANTTTNTTNTTANPSVAPSVAASVVPSVATSAQASHFASPQPKSRSTSNAPEYIPYNITSGVNSSSTGDVSAMTGGVKHGVLHFKHTTEHVETENDSDPWKTNHAISNSYHKAHSSTHPVTIHTSNTSHPIPLPPIIAGSEKVSSEISAEASFRSVSSANSSDKYEEFSPVQSAMHKDILMQAYDTTLGTTDQVDLSMGVNMTSSVSSQGPLFEMLQSLPSPLPASTMSPKSTQDAVHSDPCKSDPFAVNASISCSSHSRRRFNSRDVVNVGTHIVGQSVNPFSTHIVQHATSAGGDNIPSMHNVHSGCDGSISTVGAVFVDDRMSDDILPSNQHTVHTNTTSDPFRITTTTDSARDKSVTIPVPHKPNSVNKTESGDLSHNHNNASADTNNNNINTNNNHISNNDADTDSDARFQGLELYKCCAMKLVAKEIFWRRVDEGCERGDSLVREVLAQMLVAAHFADQHALTLSSVRNVPPYLNAADSVIPRTSSSNGGYGGKSAREDGVGVISTSVEGIALSESAASVASTNPYTSHHSNGPTEVLSALTPQQGHLPLVQLFSAFETADGFAMELELMQSMDLFDLLAEVGTLPEYHVQCIMAQLIEAVSLCHKLGIAHRDIKLSNVCFSMNQMRGRSVQSLLQTKECIRVKLADFGMAGFLARDKRLRGRCGTPGYVAPDILKADKNGSYGLNVDMFSIGVVAYTLLCGYEPFYGCDNQDLLKANKTAEFKFHRPDWDAVSTDAKDFIAKALLSSAEERLNPEGARKHVWLKGLFKNSVSGTSSMRNSGGNSVPNARAHVHRNDEVYGSERSESAPLKSCVIS